MEVLSDFQLRSNNQGRLSITNFHKIDDACSEQKLKGEGEHSNLKYEENNLSVQKNAVSSNESIGPSNEDQSLIHDSLWNNEHNKESKNEDFHLSGAIEDQSESKVNHVVSESKSLSDEQYTSSNNETQKSAVRSDEKECDDQEQSYQNQKKTVVTNQGCDDNILNALCIAEGALEGDKWDEEYDYSNWRAMSAKADHELGDGEIVSSSSFINKNSPSLKQLVTMVGIWLNIVLYIYIYIYFQLS